MIEWVMLCRETHRTDSVSVDGFPYLFVGHVLPFVALFRRMGVFNWFPIIRTERTKGNVSGGRVGT